MEEQHFDDLARLVAQKTSRRQMLKVLAGAAVGGIMGSRLSPAWAASTRSSCAQFCNQTFGPDTAATSQCLKDGKRNPNALCNSACNGGGGTLCGGPSYSTTTCCSGSTPTCTSGTCVAACVAYGGACTTDNDCCSNYYCPDQWNGTKICCVSGTSGGLAGTGCRADYECCSGTCNFTVPGYGNCAP